jgi:hypothetical protein
LPLDAVSNAVFFSFSLCTSANSSSRLLSRPKLDALNCSSTSLTASSSFIVPSAPSADVLIPSAFSSFRISSLFITFSLSG